MGEKLGAAWRDLFPEEAAGEDARDLFTQISKNIGVDGARRVFQNVLKRRRGRRKTKDETLLEVKLLTRYELMQKQGPASIKKFARHVYETRIHSISGIVPAYPIPGSCREAARAAVGPASRQISRKYSSLPPSSSLGYLSRK